MAPDAPLWQYAIVAAGGGFLGTGLRHLAKRPRIKMVIDTIAMVVLLWPVGIIIEFFRDVSPADFSAGRALLIAAVLTAIIRLSVWGIKRAFRVVMERRRSGQVRTLIQLSQTGLPSEHQKLLEQQ